MRTVTRFSTIPADRVISMTQLQKLSLRKLRAMRLEEAPLLVLDNKRREGRFVILDHETYERLIRGGEAVRSEGLDDIDFASHGLFWDRPTMTNERFAAILSESRDPDHRWAWARVLERLPSRVITRAVGLDDLSRIVSIAAPRPRVRHAWEEAIEFWRTQARRRCS